MVIIIFSHKSGGVNSTFSYYLAVLSRIINSCHFERRYFMRAHSGEEDEGWRLFRCSSHEYDKTLGAHVNRHNVLVKYEFQKRNEYNESRERPDIFRAKLNGKWRYYQNQNLYQALLASPGTQFKAYTWYENETPVMYFLVWPRILMKYGVAPDDMSTLQRETKTRRWWKTRWSIRCLIFLEKHFWIVIYFDEQS